MLFSHTQLITLVMSDLPHQRGDDDDQAFEIKYTNMKTLIAGIAGNVLEWYDFSVFGYFSDVIGHVFFPLDPKGHAALIESFAVLSVVFTLERVNQWRWDLGIVRLGGCGRVCVAGESLVVHST